ncbi:universal stress protein [Anaeromyxobacter diazotrophicus]|uniref:Universal stress protein n=1 Tax=Anaeromyxobacter diazotrophicus TaxID=2590199 RepID=A0A7I9VSY5_9BACT|nr:universal stress protein [Anaeromyxobacter diazotrophicus]GEJ59240.1 universal stress protein [Anaeromyxobacter diazotrophicus]
MPEWKNICCAVDFSDSSRVAMDYAAEIARRYEASLTLVHVHDATRASGADMTLRHRQQLLEAWRREAEFLAGRPVAGRMLEGHPAETILRFASEGSSELIVIGTHGRGGLKRLVLGSVAEHVVHRADCPVLVSRHFHRPT